jgi:hypothetical protein
VCSRGLLSTVGGDVMRLVGGTGRCNGGFEWGMNDSEAQSC